MELNRFFKLTLFFGSILVLGYGASWTIYSTVLRQPLLQASVLNYEAKNNNPTVDSLVLAQTEKIAEDDVVHIVAVGDIMLDRGVLNVIKRVGYGDFFYPFEHVSRTLSDADIAFANLEGPISNVGNNVGSQYSFRMQPETAEALSKAGFDVVSFANNHAGDWNRAAFIDTLSWLKNSGIGYTGAGLSTEEAESPYIIEKKGLRIGFIAFSDVGPNWLRATEDSPGILVAEPDYVNSVVRRAKEQVDILLVSFHFGEEYESSSSDRQKLLAHTAVYAGADAILGHHPHVTQEIEIYNGKPIAYSLGNFIFDQRFSEETSFGLMLDISVSKQGILSHQVRNVEFNKYYQPSHE